MLNKMNESSARSVEFDDSRNFPIFPRYCWLDSPLNKKQISVKKENPKNSITSKLTRRGGVRNKYAQVKPKSLSHLKIFFTNGAGVKNGKVASLNAEVRNTQASIVTIQETHCRQKGKIPHTGDKASLDRCG